MVAVNKEYKDRLFKFIFDSPENKEWALSLYNESTVPPTRK